MIQENLKLSGQLSAVLRDKTGAVKTERTVKNLVVSSGLIFILARMVGVSKLPMTHMALGSGTTAAAAGQTALVTQLGAREALDGSTTTSTGGRYSVNYTATFEAGDAVGPITEAGIFNASTSGDMLCRTTFNVVNKEQNDTMSITWTVSLAAS